MPARKTAPKEYYRLNAVRHDGPLRFMVPSRTAGQLPYLVQLDTYDFNGFCVCKHFACRLEGLLKQGLTGTQAVERGLVEVPEWGTVEDGLRCFHIHVARLKYADDVLQAIKAQKKDDGDPF